MADSLAGFRGDPKSNVPQPVEDASGAPPAAPHDGEDAARKAATAPTPAVPLDTGQRTPVFVDRQRQALAERFKKDRVEERKAGLPASHVPFIDGDNPAIPGALPAEEPEPADPDAAAEAREKAEADRVAALAAGTPAEPTADVPTKPYTLTVDRNTFTVSREELLRYAEIDEKDADGLSEPAIVRLAQKQIAASNRLREADAIKDQARRETIAPQQEPQPRPQPQPQPAPARRPDPALVSAIEKIQLGDPEEAAAALQSVFDAGVDHALRANNQTRAVNGVQAEYATGVNSFTQEHPGVIQDPYLSSAHIGLVAREIADDIKGLGLLDEATYAKIATNPALAAEAFTLARAEGRPVRSPEMIFKAASDKFAAIAAYVADQTRTPTPAPAPQPRAAPSRIEEKRALMPQPARSGISQIGAATDQAPTEDRMAVWSAAIQKTRKARFQPTS
jgi:hypothetical protein